MSLPSLQNEPGVVRWLMTTVMLSGICALPRVTPASSCALGPAPKVTKPKTRPKPVRGKNTPVEIDPELRKKMEQVLGAEAAKEALKQADQARANRSRQRRQPPPTRPGAARPTSPRRTAARPRGGAGKPGDSATTTLNIPPVEQETPPEERVYRFSIVDGTYEQLVQGFARQTGLGVIGETPKDGRVSFVSSEALSFREALSRIRMLLFNYKPLEPYWIDYEGTHLMVSRINDLYRQLGMAHMFRSVEAFKASGLPEDELALVVYTPKGSLADLKQVRDHLPDYVRVAPVEHTNSVTIFALVKDINKYLELVEFFGQGGKSDIRPIERIPIEHITPTEALDKIRELMDLGGVAPRARTRVTARGKDSPLNILREPEVSILPDDVRGVLIVRAMKSKIDEIRALLPYVDLPVSSEEFPPVIIRVRHVNPDLLIKLVQQVLAASGTVSAAGGARAGAKRTTTRTPTRGAMVSPSTSTDSVTMFRHPSRDAIVVIASDEKLQRVRELIDRFDVEGAKPVRIPLAHINATELSGLLTPFLGGTMGKGKPQGETYRIVPDRRGDAVWFVGGARDLERVRAAVSALDMEKPERSLHAFHLRYQKPSFAANLLVELDKDAGGGATGIGNKSVRPGKPRSISISKFTPDDDEGTLYILCTESEWARYQPFIEQIDHPASTDPTFVVLPVTHITPTKAVELITPLIQHSDPRKVTARMVAGKDGVYVYGANQVQLSDMRAVLAEVDNPVELEERVFDIRYADLGEIKSAIESMVGGEDGAKAAPGRARPGGKGVVVVSRSNELTLLVMGGRLLVRTTPEKMQVVAELIERFDVPKPTHETRVYEDFAPGTDIEAMADTLMSLFGGSHAGNVRAKSKVRGTSPEGARFVPLPSAGQLVVMADKDQFADIETMIDLLRNDVKEDHPIEVAFLDVVHADPDVLAEQMQPLLELKLKEMTETESGPALTPAQKRITRPGSTGGFHLAADARNHRLVLAAPAKLIDHARELLVSFDQEDEAEGVIFETVSLHQAKASEMVKAVREMLGGKGRRPVSRAKTKTAATSTAPPEEPLAVVEAPGGEAVVLHGQRKEVEETIEWIKHLDGISTPGRSIKVYQINHADIKTLGDLIVAVVDRPAQRPGVKVPRPARNAPPEDDGFEFEVSKTWTGSDLYIHADLIARTMIVATTESNLAQIDAIVERFENDEEVPIGDSDAVPHFVYELEHADALDAAFNAEMLFDQLWSGRDKPQVESALFGNSLVVRYPDKSRFDEIRELLKKYIDKLPEGANQTKQASIMAPQGMTAEQVARLLQMNHPELDIDVENKTEKQDITYGLETVRPRNPAPSGHPCVMPASFSNLVRQALISALGQTAAQTKRKSTDKVKKGAGQRRDGRSSQDMVGAIGQVLLSGQPGDDEDQPKRSKKLAPGQRVIIRYNNNTGEVKFEAPASVLEELSDWEDELKKEIESLPTVPDIRVVRLKYIDVYSAAEILEEMFNATRQQRASQEAARRRAQQQQQQLQARQRAQAQRAGQTGGQPGGRENQPRGPRGQQPPQVQVPQLPPTSVRVFPNPRDRTLILRADTNQYPGIFEMLATIDQPKPIDSEMRIYPLEKLNAVEVEEMLKEVLGLNESGGRRPTPPARAGGARGRASRPAASRRSTNGALPRTIMQETITGSVLGIDPGDIKLTSNEAANTIVAVAPQVALDFIGELIEKLESEEVPERETRYYELAHADPDEIAAYLETQFVEATKSVHKGEGAGRSLNTPSFIPYPRLHMLTVLATAEQLGEIETLIDRMDVKDDSTQWRDVTLEHADAGAAAETLERMFAASVGGGARPKGGAPRAVVRFIGEEGGRMLLFQVPEALHDQIMAAIEKLEADASEKSSVRLIKLTNAIPSKIVEAVENAYGAGSGRGRQRAAQFSITAHDPSKTLFVKADDVLFGKIESLVKILDQPRTFDFDFRIYPLKYADAKKTHELMTKLMRDYIARLGRSGGQVEAFSVEADERANALIVLGSPAVFGFLEENLARVDIPANAPPPEGYMMIALKNADANEVAQNINRMWAGKKKGAGEQEVRAEANRSLNMLIVRGPQDQLDEINKQFIEPLKENMPPPLRTETIALQYAQPEMVAESINRFFEDKKKAYQVIGKGNTISPLEFTVAVTPDVNTRQIIVQANDENMSLIKSRVALLDREDVAIGSATRIKIYPIKYADPNGVVNIINQWSKTRTQTGQGRKVAARDVVNAVAEQATQSVVVTASEANHQIIEELIKGLDDESLATGRRKQQVIKLAYANAQEVVNQLTQLFRQGRRQRRGDPGPMFIADAKSNSVAASVNRQELEEVQDFLSQIDKEPPSESKRTTEVYPLQYADPGALNAVVLNMFRWDRRSQPSPSETVTSAVEWATQSLIVTASPKNHNVIKAFIEKVDVESNSAKETHIYKLEHADAEEIAQSLQNVYRSRRSTRRGDQPVQIEPDTSTNSLLITANETEMEELTKLIRSLDVEPDLQRGRQIKSLALKNADPYNVVEAIKQLFGQGRGRGANDQVTAVADGGTRSVIVSASAGNMTRVEGLIAQLDTDEGGQQAVHVVQLVSADPAAAARTLTEIYIRSKPNRGKGVPPITISALQGSKAILVKAGAEDFADIQKTIEELDRDGAMLGEEVRVVTLLYADATEVHTAMQEYLKKPGGGGRGSELTGNMRLSVLTQGNAIVISGDKPDVDRIEQLVKQLDTADEDRNAPQVIALTHASVSQIVPTLEDMFSNTTRGGGGRRGKQAPYFGSNEALNAVIVKADRTDLAAIRGIIEQLDTKEAAAGEAFRLIPVATGINVTDLAAKVEESVNNGAQMSSRSGGGRGRSRTPSIIITPDTRTSSLIVSGDASLFDGAEKLTNKLVEMGPTGKAIKIISLGDAPADDVLRLIATLKGEGGARGRGAMRRGGGTRGRSGVRRSSSTRPRSGARRSLGGTRGRSGVRRGSPTRPRSGARRSGGARRSNRGRRP